jgi:hypothetical protein
MGFEVYFQVGVNSRPEIPIEGELRALFGKTKDDPSGSGFLAVLGDGECWISTASDDEGRVLSFTVHRPSEDAALWEGLHRLLTRYQYCAYWAADECRPVVGRDDVELDPDMVETLGPARRLTSETDLLNWVRLS